MKYIFLIANVLAACWIFGLNVYNGWLTDLVTNDHSKISFLIMVLFAATLAHTTRVTLMKKGSVEMIERSSSWMANLGMIGTFIGLGISLSGINMESMASPEGIKEISTMMVTGLRTELASVLVGAIFGLWTEVNFFIAKRA